MQNLVSFAKAWAGTYRNHEEQAEEGQTIIEYALIVAVVSIVLIGLMAGFGSSLVSGAKAAVDALAPGGGGS